MNVIRVLPEKVASQIAAGEVIDRPASVVRELVDNSIDAGADRIVVMIQKGGKRLVKVSDNGMGMSRDDLLLSVERHATSKIETASDLFSVTSLGFRGEALPSIASVSRMRMTTRGKEQLSGHRLKIEGGRLIAIDEIGAPSGTVIEVMDLFYNIPARRKFLRADKTEMDHIIGALSRTALPYGGISFKLDHGGKTLLHLPASDQLTPRLSVLMGRKTAQSVIKAQHRDHALTITVHLAPSSMSRSRGDRLYVYVNGRNIRDRVMNKAVIEGYGQRLMKGQYPQAVIFIDMNASMVDVNVHPTKQEVRFSDAPALFKAIVSTIEKALARSTHAFGNQIPLEEDGPIFTREGRGFLSQPVWGYGQKEQGTGVLEGAQAYARPMRPGPQVIGQLGNTYILCQREEGLLMVDQHAAHERIVYENLKKDIRGSHLESQILLTPHRLELSLKEKGIVLEKGMALSRFGIELDHFGGATFLMRSHPAILKNVQWDSFLSELIAELEHGELDDDIILDRVLTVMACHGAIRAGHRMSHEEMVQLLSQLEQTDLPTNCPHGRPISKSFTFYDIEKMFKRVV
ncbi:MAG: DNA mismatch repair endonuclease MutL [Deltaproteobacteria bacterium]|nr:DNA mismatch repair endonuclease MutL [Deltaproteobacteria bacterium]